MTQAASVPMPANRMELMGVRYLGWSRVNHAGTMPSHPATMGRRAPALNERQPVQKMLANKIRIVMGARMLATPNDRSPKLKACGTGPMRLIWFEGTKTKIALVPKMYKAAITGAEIKTDLRMVRTGLRHSPARIAMNSNPHSAPKVILLNTLRLNSFNGGVTRGNGPTADEPRQNRNAERKMSSPSASTVINPPAFTTHLPICSPNAEITTNTASRTTEQARIIPLLAAIHSAVGPTANAM